MTKEGLEKEAEEKFKINNKDKDREHYYDRMWFKTGYLAGAEPREKRIAELEDKIADIKANCDLAIEGRDIKIKELEKENKELKSLTDFQMRSNIDNYSILKKSKEQLTKATELLKKLILEVRGYEEINGYDTCEPVQEAEQFLKECK